MELENQCSNLFFLDEGQTFCNLVTFELSVHGVPSWCVARRSLSSQHVSCVMATPSLHRLVAAWSVEALLSSLFPVSMGLTFFYVQFGSLCWYALIIILLLGRFTWWMCAPMRSFYLAFSFLLSGFNATNIGTGDPVSKRIATSHVLRRSFS